MRAGSVQRKDWLKLARGATGAAARDSRRGTVRAVLWAAIPAVWPATWVLRILHLIPKGVLPFACLSDALIVTGLIWYFQCRSRHTRELQRQWREQRGRMRDAVFGGSTGNLSDMHGADDPDSPAAKLAACQEELDRRRAEQALRCDPGVMERLEALEEQGGRNEARTGELFDMMSAALEEADIQLPRRRNGLRLVRNDEAS